MEIAKQKKSKHDLTRKAYKTTRSFIRNIRRLAGIKNKHKPKDGSGLRVAFIHNEKKILTGAHHINQIMATALSQRGAVVKNFYPKWQLADTPTHMRGVANILFFHSLLERKDDILRFNLIQGTTYTPLPFLSFKIPTISHFGSTTAGFLKSVPKTAFLSVDEISVWKELRDLEIIQSFNLETFRPLRDIADMEKLVATRVTKCIATSENVKKELVEMGVPLERIGVIHNAIEDYWFEKKEFLPALIPHIVFLGRLGGDVFTLKLKGLDRLVGLYRLFPNTPKTTVFMTTNKKLKDWLRVAFPIHHMYVNMRKDLIPNILAQLYGSILFIPSRYEGFSLSLIEGMSQGLVPVSYPVGVASEIIRNGENGFIVSSEEEAQERINYLFSDKNKRLEMAESARKSVAQFCSANIADKLIFLYRDLKEEHKKITPN